MGTENRRLYSVGDTADDFLRPHPPHLTYFTALHAQLLWTSSAMRRLMLMAKAIGVYAGIGIFRHTSAGLMYRDHGTRPMVTIYQQPISLSIPQSGLMFMAQGHLTSSASSSIVRRWH